MKIITMLAAAGIAATSIGMSTSASAQSWRSDGYRDGYRDNSRGDGYRDRDRRGYRDRDRGRYDRNWRGDRRHYGWDRGRRWGGYDRGYCRTIWRYGHRVRVCR